MADVLEKLAGQYESIRTSESVNAAISKAQSVDELVSALLPLALGAIITAVLVKSRLSSRSSGGEQEERPEGERLPTIGAEVP